MKQNKHVYKHWTQNFWRTSPFDIAPVQKVHTAIGDAGTVNLSIWFINTRFFKSFFFF